MEQPNSLVKIALAEVVQKVNSGTNPTDALKKVASDLDLNPNYIHRVGEALNVALHYNHFKTASDRSAGFAIADIPGTISSIFDKTEKTASEYISEHFPTSESNDEVFNFNRALNNPKYKQAYLEITGATATEDSYGLTMKGAFDKAAKLLRDLEQNLDNCKTEKVGAELDLNKKFSKLAAHFRRDEGYRTSFEEFESQVFSKHGEASVPYLDLIYKTAGIEEERGVHDSKYNMFSPVAELGMYDDFMKAAAALGEAEGNLKTAEADYTFEKEYYSEIGKLVAGNGTLSKQAEEAPIVVAKKKNKPTKTAESRDPILERIEKKAALKKEASPLSLFSLANLVGAGKAMGEHRLYEELSSRGGKKPGGSSHAHNMTMENMERQLILQELMLTDPILSRANPQKVVKAYEQILRLSPQVSKEKEVLRAMLRQAVASQAIAPHDADQLTKLDMDMMKRKIVSDSYLRGNLEGIKF
jgi:hypothetical protein